MNFHDLVCCGAEEKSRVLMSPRVSSNLTRRTGNDVALILINKQDFMNDLYSGLNASHILRK